MSPVIATVDVDRPAAEVFAYATDPTRFPEWQAASSTVTWIPPAPRRWAPSA